MKLPLRWLKEYVDFNVTIDEFVELLMWRGFEVAAVQKELPDVENVVVGRILTVEAHPDAKKLHVCKVDSGENGILTIVCGAPNAEPDALVPLALAGAKLPGNITISPTNMRGVLSHGMLCSGKELGLTDADYPGAEVDGLLILEGNHEPGELIEKALDMDSVIFDIELTPNRPDCQSIIGMCREAAAALGQKFKEPKIREVPGAGNAADYAKVTIQNRELCSRYTARVITDLNIKPSPRWLQKKLRSVGLRPINNIVDITNLVMVEYGHPMHAFDLSCIAEGHIVVRNAYENEKVVTLDGKVREVTPDMLLIADPQKGVGIAGVMGGENSEITEATKVTLFESAVFKGSNIRATSRKLNLVTDAASRFIKGVEPVNALKALQRGIELVDELGAGKVIGGTIDVCYADTKPKKVNIDWQHVNRLLNLSLTPEEMAGMLSSIDIDSEIKGENLEISVPHYRVDIEDGIEADWDIAEEIARIYGYYNIKPTLMSGDTFRGRVGSDFKAEDAMKDLMVAMGAYEMYNYNFISPADLDNMQLAPDSEKRLAVRLLNPFGEDQSLMRTTLIPGMLKVLALNINRKTGHGRFFEVGNVHFDNNPDLPEERKLLGLAFINDEDFYTLKGSVEILLEEFGIHDYEFVKSDVGYLQPGQQAKIMCGDTCIGELGTVHPKLRKAYDIPTAAYVAEIDFKKLLKHSNTNKTFVPLPRYPTVPRDIAIVVDEHTESGEVVKTLKSVDLGNVLLEDIKLFDVYRGNNIPEGKKSMAYSFALRSDEHTLTEAEIKASIDAMLKALEARLGARLRS